MTKYLGLKSNSNPCIVENSVYCLLLMTIFLMLPDGAAAAAPTKNSISMVICNVVKQVTGPIGQGVATIAVVFVSLGFFMGKTSMGILLATGVGIGMLFGAETIVSMVSGGGPITCATGDASAP